MKSILMTLVIMAALNTLILLWNGLTKTLPVITPSVMFLDAVYSLGMGGWALWLLARGGQ